MDTPVRISTRYWDAFKMGYCEAIYEQQHPEVANVPCEIDHLKKAMRSTDEKGLRIMQTREGYVAIFKKVI